MPPSYSRVSRVLSRDHFETHSLPERPEGSPSGLFFCPPGTGASRSNRARTGAHASQGVEPCPVILGRPDTRTAGFKPLPRFPGGGDGAGSINQPLPDGSEEASTQCGGVWRGGAGHRNAEEVRLKLAEAVHHAGSTVH